MTQAATTYTIDYFFMLQHRRLRATFQMETLERHSSRLQTALEARQAALDASTPQPVQAGG
jgi:hypothetical protein